MEGKKKTVLEIISEYLAPLLSSMLSTETKVNILMLDYDDGFIEGFEWSNPEDMKRQPFSVTIALCVNINGALNLDSLRNNLVYECHKAEINELTGFEC